MKRQGVALVVVLAILASAGCVDVVLGDDLVLEAEPAGVDQSALESTAFQPAGTDALQLDETVTVAGQERVVRATNHLATYERPVDLPSVEQQGGAFVVVSTPDYAIAGRSANPVADMSNRELVDRFRGQLEDQLGELRDVREVDERTEPVLGGAATVTTYAADTEFEGETITVNVHVTKVAHEDDVIVALGVHPEALQQQAPEIFSLMRGVEHPSGA